MNCTQSFIFRFDGIIKGRLNCLIKSIIEHTVLRSCFANFLRSPFSARIISNLFRGSSSGFSPGNDALILFINARSTAAMQFSKAIQIVFSLLTKWCDLLPLISKNPQLTSPHEFPWHNNLLKGRTHSFCGRNFAEQTTFTIQSCLALHQLK